MDWNRVEGNWKHVWTAPVVQEVFRSDEHRSGAPMCSACSRSTEMAAGPDEVRRSSP